MPFAAEVARCQRVLGEAREQCLSRSMRRTEACWRSQLDGGSCDEVALAAAIAGAVGDTTPAIDTACSDAQARAIYFLNRSEAVTDKDFICTRVPEEIASFLYQPAIAAGWQLESEAAACVARASAVAVKYLRVVAKQQTRTLDRIAVRPGPPSVINGRINRTNARVGRIRTALAASLARDCPTLVELYGRNAIQLLLQVELHAQCAVGAGYIQSAYACPRGYLPR